MLTGRVFDISRGCVDDGPGLRTVVFLKGCHLRCPWCHNLEGLAFEPEIAWDEARCIGCGRCAQACPRRWPSRAAWRLGCERRARCVTVCPARARRLVGRDWEPGALVAELLDEEAFLRAGGGVTFSGGEPLAQPDFVFACATGLRAAGIDTAVETAGFWPRRLLPRLEAFDLVLFDLKHVDARKLRDVLGTGPGPILDNLAALLRSGQPLEVRLTLVPGFNDGEADLRAIGRWLRGHTPAPLRASVLLQPFHRLAVAKSGRLGRAYPYASHPPTSRPALEAAAAALRAEGLSLIEP